MQKATKRRIVVLGTVGTLATAVSGPMDVFRTADLLTRTGRVAGPRFRCQLVCAETPMQTSAGFAIDAANVPLRSSPDAILVAAGGANDADVLARARAYPQVHPAVVRWMQRCAARGTNIAAACAGTAWLAAAGLLTGRRATTSWWLCDPLARAYPDVHVQRHAMVVQDGPFHTAGAAMAVLDLSLHLVRELANPLLSARCAKELVLDGNRRSQAMYASLTHLPASDGLVRKAVAHMLDHPAGGSVAELARTLGATPRTLQRSFLRDVQCTPKAFWQRVRIEAARTKLETTRDTVNEIADAVGFADATAFRRAFRKHLSMSPSEYRTATTNPFEG